MNKKSTSVFEAMQELSSAIGDMQEAWLSFLKSQMKARAAAERFNGIITEVLSQPNIEIKDYEIDG